MVSYTHMHTDTTISTRTTPAVLVAANRAIVYGRVARWLMHDIRSPAQALSLITELMSEPGADADADLRHSLQDSTQQLAGYIETLDHILRPLPDSIEPAPVVLADILAFLKRIGHSCRLSVELDLSQATTQSIPAVVGVEEYVEHALLNLLMNALEAIAERDDGRIAISAAVHDGHVELVVDDNGPGLAPELHERLFEPYVTTKSSPARATGLGLPVARLLVEQFGGTLTYTPKPTPGARFTMRLVPWRASPR